MLKKPASAKAVSREASLVKRISSLQTLIFLLARYASRFTNDGLLEIRFTNDERRWWSANLLAPGVPDRLGLMR